MIEKHFKTAATVYKLEAAPDSTRKYEAVSTLTVYGVLMPAAAVDEALLEGAYDEVNKFMCQADSGIAKSDKLVIGGKDYFVGAMRNFNNDIGSEQHEEFIIYQPNG